MEFFPRPRLPYELASMTAQLAASQNDPLALGIQTLGQGIGEGIGAIGKAKVERADRELQQKQLEAKLIAEQEAAGKRMAAEQELKLRSQVLEGVIAGGSLIDAPIPGADGKVDLTSVPANAIDLGAFSQSFKGKLFVPPKQKEENLIELTDDIVKDAEAKGAKGLVVGSKMKPADLLKAFQKKESEEKAPPGYRFKRDGTLEAIKGGPAEQKLEASKEKAKSTLATRMTQTKNVIATVDAAFKKVGWTTTGLAGNALKEIGGTSAADLEGLLDTVKANLGFDRLTQMRAESPTGGALGQVSNIELDLLTSTMAALRQKQSPEQLRDNLQKVKTHLTNWMSAVQAAESGATGPQGEGKESKTLIEVWTDSDEKRLAELEKKLSGGRR